MAVCRSRIQILTEKCILRIPLSSDFLQIIGRKQIDGQGIQKTGLDSKGLSAIESNSNLAKTLFEDYSFGGLFFCVSESGKHNFFGEMFNWVV